MPQINPVVAGLRSSAIRDLLALTRAPGALSLAGGCPAADTFPAERIAAVTTEILATDPAAGLQYGPTVGDPLLREWITVYESTGGCSLVAPSRVLVTSGSQQALDL